MGIGRGSSRWSLIDREVIVPQGGIYRVVGAVSEQLVDRVER